MSAPTKSLFSRYSLNWAYISFAETFAISLVLKR
jgi:hypothetical protein